MRSPKGSRPSTPTRQSLGWFHWNISLRSVFETIAGGTTLVFVAFALALGVRAEDMGFFAAAISFACILQVLGLPLLQSIRKRKRMILALAVLEPLLVMAAVLLVPFLEGTWRPLFLGVAVFLAAACLHMTRPYSEDWLATTIPSGLRGRYTGRRIRLSSLAIVGSTLAAGIAMEVLGQENTMGLAGLLVLGASFGVAAALTLGRAARPILEEPPGFHPGDLLGVWRYRSFVRLTLATVIYMIPFYFACAYYQVFNLEVVQMRPGLIAAMGVGYLVVKLLVTPAFGRLCDRIGPRKLLWSCSPIYVGFFFCFPLAGPGNAWPILIAWAMVGAADGMFGVAMPTALYGTVPAGGNRPAFFAVYNLLVLFFFGLGSILAVPLVRFLQEESRTLVLFGLEGYYLFYALCGLAMIPSACAVLLVPPRQAARTGGVALSTLKSSGKTGPGLCG